MPPCRSAGSTPIAQHVNESWGDDHSFGINDALGCGIDGRAAEQRNSVAGDAHIRVNPGVAGSVYDSAVADQNVVLLSQKCPRYQQQENPDRRFHDSRSVTVAWFAATRES